MSGNLHWGICVFALVAVACGAPHSREAGERVSHSSTVATALTSTVPYATVDTFFRARCVSCHSGPKPAMELDLTSYEGLVKGTSHGRVIAIGDSDPDLSVMMASLGEPRAAMRMKGTGGDGDPTRHTAIAGSVSEADIQMMATWIQEGAQPTGSLEERAFALMLLHIITLDNNQDGFYTWKHMYSSSLADLRMAPIGGVQISVTRADAVAWEARVLHPGVRSSCVVSGSVNQPRLELNLSTAKQFCAKLP